MNRWIATTLAAALSIAAVPNRTLADEKIKQDPSESLIEIAILLDTSGSMEGLINQARTRIWSIINTLASSKRNGEVPDMKVALYEYGKSSVPAEAGHVRRIVDLSDDLDKISAELFALTTNGGSEHCGQAIDFAVRDLAWTAGDHYKAIFIAGNEPFTQGPVDYRQSCAAAIKKGIVVNTIHCGNESEGRQGQWTEAPKLADGQAINIDHNAQSVAVAAPQDGRIQELGRKLNDTYVAFGRQGEKRRELQQAQDAAAGASGASVAAERAVAKSGKGYTNAEWDLIDAAAENEEVLKKLDEESMPAELRGLSEADRAKFVADKSAERKQIQDEIQKLNDERKAFIAGEMKKLAGTGAETFDTAIQAILKDQLTRKGYELK